jgi:hypothetical protein
LWKEFLQRFLHQIPVRPDRADQLTRPAWLLVQAGLDPVGWSSCQASAQVRMAVPAVPGERMGPERPRPTVPAPRTGPQRPGPTAPGERLGPDPPHHAHPP